MASTLARRLSVSTICCYQLLTPTRAPPSGFEYLSNPSRLVILALSPMFDQSSHFQIIGGHFYDVSGDMNIENNRRDKSQGTQQLRQAEATVDLSLLESRSSKVNHGKTSRSRGRRPRFQYGELSSSPVIHVLDCRIGLEDSTSRDQLHLQSRSDD
jgi:hypothetical protein